MTSQSTKHLNNQTTLNNDLNQIKKHKLKLIRLEQLPIL